MVNLKCIGLKSGTSMDGIDAALIETDGQSTTKQLYTASLKYDPKFQILLKTAEYSVIKYNGSIDLAEKLYQQEAKGYLEKLYKDTKIITKELSLYLYENEDQDISDHSTLLDAEIVIELLFQANIKSGIDLYRLPQAGLISKPTDGIALARGLDWYYSNR